MSELLSVLAYKADRANDKVKSKIPDVERNERFKILKSQLIQNKKIHLHKKRVLNIGKNQNPNNIETYGSYTEKITLVYLYLQ